MPGHGLARRAVAPESPRNNVSWGAPPRALDLGGAIIACERAYRRERAAAESAETLWAIRRPRLDLMILSELRLLLRFLRRRAPHRFGEILGAVAEE